MTLAALDPCTRNSGNFSQPQRNPTPLCETLNAVRVGPNDHHWVIPHAVSDHRQGQLPKSARQLPLSNRPKHTHISHFRVRAHLLQRHLSLLPPTLIPLTSHPQPHLDGFLLGHLPTYHAPRFLAHALIPSSFPDDRASNSCLTLYAVTVKRLQGQLAKFVR